MKDQALEKLIEEIRTASAASKAFTERYSELEQEQLALRKDALAAHKRYEKLKRVLDAHILDGKDIIQAKLEMDNEDETSANTYLVGELGPESFIGSGVRNKQMAAAKALHRNMTGK